MSYIVKHNRKVGYWADLKYFFRGPHQWTNRRASAQVFESLEEAQSVVDVNPSEREIWEVRDDGWVVKWYQDTDEGTDYWCAAKGQWLGPECAATYGSREDALEEALTHSPFGRPVLRTKLVRVRPKVYAIRWRNDDGTLGCWVRPDKGFTSDRAWRALWTTPQPLIGWVAKFDGRGRVLVELPGNAKGVRQ